MAQISTTMMSTLEPVEIQTSPELSYAPSSIHLDSRLPISGSSPSLTKASVETSALNSESQPRVRVKVSSIHKYTLLFLFCLAQILDTLNNGALWAALPTLVELLGLSQAQSTWLISTYQLTFASFLLISGRISDVYGAKGAFIGGMAGICVISLICGFVKQAIGLMVLRAILGIAAALSIPSSASLIVALFPEPREQARAIGIFTSTGGFANVLGLVLGAIFVQYASWRWCFWFSAVMSSPIAILCFWIIPPDISNFDSSSGNSKAIQKARGMDLFGTGLLTVAFILFIFSVISGSSYGWATAAVLVPLPSSILLIGIFFYWETRVPPHMAAIPPKTWFYPNFFVIIFLAFLPYFWFNTSLSFYMTYWPESWGWSIISSVVHMLPVGIASFLFGFTGPLSNVIHPKWIILTGLASMVAGTALLSVASTPDRYWPFALPGLILGSTGAMLTYTHSNIAILRSTPSSMAGTVSAIFNAVLLMGSALGISIVNSMATSIDAKHPHATGALAYKGRQAGIYLLLGGACVGLVSVAVFFKRSTGIGSMHFEAKYVNEKMEGIVEEC